MSARLSWPPAEGKGVGLGEEGKSGSDGGEEFRLEVFVERDGEVICTVQLRNCCVKRAG
jgi:hypothetical protein